MPKVEEIARTQPLPTSAKLPVSVIVATRNEENNLPRCLEALREVGEVYVIDSGSTDATPKSRARTALRSCNFTIKAVGRKSASGPWKIFRWPLTGSSWSMPTRLSLPNCVEEISAAIRNPEINGYYVSLQMYFLGRPLRHGGAGFWKLSLFRRGKGAYECRLKDQDSSMADMEIHEHVVVEGKTARLRNPLIHHNVSSLSRYIQKHDEYSNWEAKVWAGRRRPTGNFPHRSSAPRRSDAAG